MIIKKIIFYGKNSKGYYLVIEIKKGNDKDCWYKFQQNDEERIFTDLLDLLNYIDYTKKDVKKIKKSVDK